MSEPENFRRSLKTVGGAIKLKAGKTLQFQGSEVDYIYYIETGTAVAKQFSCDGKENRLAQYESGEFIGIEHIYSKSVSKYEVAALTYISVVKVKRTKFLEFITTNPDANEYVIKYILGRLRNSQSCLFDSHMLKKRGRVMSEIKRMAEASHFGSASVISPKPVFSEMAARLGIARETVSRTVSDLVRSNIIENQKNMILVKDAAMLESIIR